MRVTGALINISKSGAPAAERQTCCAGLTELPPPPAGRTGWPWTMESPPVPALRVDGSPWPRMTIVTPSYNQAGWIEETIRSVLLQGYPDLEYIVIDGGSTDGSVDIIRKYSRWLTYFVSETDAGQADAINKGIGRGTGTYLNWLNSDDALLAGTCQRVASIAALTGSPWLISGARIQCDQAGNPFNIQTAWKEFWTLYRFGIPNFAQEASFFSREAWDRCGPLDTRFDFVFDTAFHASILKHTDRIALTSMPLGKMHVYAGMKTLRKDDHRDREIETFWREYTSIGARLVNRLANTRGHKLLIAVLSLLKSRKTCDVVDYDPWTASLRVSRPN